jgi:hypothetical protein
MIITLDSTHMDIPSMWVEPDTFDWTDWMKELDIKWDRQALMKRYEAYR